MTIETWGFNVSTSKGKFAASLRQVATQVIALAVARDHLCDRHAAHTGWFLGEPAGGRQRRSLDDLLRSARINELMAVAGVKSRRTIALEETAWMNHSMADWLIYCFADHVDVPLVTALDCYFIDFHGLKEWFWEGKRRFAYDTTPGDNGAICRLVNIGDVCAAVWTMRYQLPV